MTTSDIAGITPAGRRMSDITERLRSRVVNRWIHATGQTPQASGYAPDADCTEAADTIEALRAEVEAQKQDAAHWREMLRRYHAASQRVYASIGSVDGAEQRAAADACRTLEREVGEALAAQEHAHG